MVNSIFMAGNFLSASGGVRGPGENLSLRLEAEGWRVIRAGTSPKAALRFFETLIKALFWGRKTRVSIVDVYSGRAFLLAYVVSGILKVLGSRVILVLHGGGLPAFDRRHPRFVEQLFSRAFQIVTPSQYLKKYFSPRYAEIVYLPNGLDISAYTFRKRSNPRPRICWLRAFHSIYQPLMAIEAVRALRVEFPDIHLVMAGPDKKDGSFDAAAKLIGKYGLERNIEIRGCLDYSEVPGFLSQSDIFLNTTSLESFGLAMMEAAASGLCIVTTNAGEVPMLWEDGENCLQVELSDPLAMSESIRRLLREPLLAGKLSEGARQKACGFDWTFIFPQWKELVYA